MSATGRKKRTKGTPDGEVTPREALDNYPTPGWVTRVLVKHIGFDLRGKRVLEPSAGDGFMVRELAMAGALVDAVEIDTGRAERVGMIEIPDAVHGLRKAARSVTCANFLTHPIRGEWDAVIMNPPYGEKVMVKGKEHYRDLALEFVEKALTLSPVVCAILRLHWAGSGGRVKFHAKHPADLVVLANRPKFKAGGDAAEYAWWIWRRGASVGTWCVVAANDAPSRGRPKTNLRIVEDAKDIGGKAEIATGAGRTSLPA